LILIFEIFHDGLQSLTNEDRSLTNVTSLFIVKMGIVGDKLDIIEDLLKVPIVVITDSFLNQGDIHRQFDVL